MTEESEDSGTRKRANVRGDGPSKYLERFNAGEVQLLNYIRNKISYGQNPDAATRHKDWPNLCRKIQRMWDKRVEDNKKEA